MSKYRFPDLSRFPDCIALLENGKCTRLSVTNCLGKGCTFRRTRQEDSDSIYCTHHRLSGLSSSAQRHIADKYYRGSMPWNEK